MPKLVEVAERYLYVREQPKGSNRGPEIDRWLKAVGSPLGSAWCAAFAYGVASEAGASWPWAKSGRVQTLVDSGRLLPASKAEPDDLVVFWFQGLGRYAHIAVCTGRTTGRILTIDGNTIADGATGDQREGWGVFPKNRLLSDRIKVLRPA